IYTPVLNRCSTNIREQVSGLGRGARRIRRTSKVSAISATSTANSECTLTDRPRSLLHDKRRRERARQLLDPLGPARQKLIGRHGCAGKNSVIIEDDDAAWHHERR